MYEKLNKERNISTQLSNIKKAYLITDVLCAHGDGFLHGNEREDLQQVVQHDVPHDAEAVEVATAARTAP